MKRGDLERRVAAGRMPGGEASRMARPILTGVGFVLRVYHWPVLLLVGLYFLSGVTTVKPGEVALVFRFGKLVGDDPKEQLHEPGLLWTFPSPIDRVERINLDEVRALRVDGLTYSGDGFAPSATFARRETIDPEVDGYCITGDRNLLNVDTLALYRIKDPIAWSLNHAAGEAVLRDAIMSAFTQHVGAKEINFLYTGRKDLAESVRADVQSECDGYGLGIELLALQLDECDPPLQVRAAFNSVVNSLSLAVQMHREALEEYARQVPSAEAEARRALADARNFSARRVAVARGEADAFKALLASSGIEGRAALRERLYRESLERALSGVQLRLLPPPATEAGYEDMQIVIPVR